MAANNKKVTKKKTVSVEPHGQVHIKASFNNVIISITNQTGQVISWASAGKWVLEAPKKIHPMLHKWHLQIARKLQLTQV